MWIDRSAVVSSGPDDLSCIRRVYPKPVDALAAKHLCSIEVLFQAVGCAQIFFMTVTAARDPSKFIISVIVGSTRQGRFSEKPAKWIFERLQAREAVDARLLDLRDFPMPFFDQPVSPSMPGRAPFTEPTVQKWTRAIGESDAFIIATPEYNYGPPAVLKNAIDWVSPEWNKKPIAFVSWGAANGARGVQQLREISVPLQLHPIRTSVYVPFPLLLEHMQGKEPGAGWAELEGPTKMLLDELTWWTQLLKPARST